jgi:uncharacterized protein YjlB
LKGRRLRVASGDITCIPNFVKMRQLVSDVEMVVVGCTLTGHGNLISLENNVG